MTLVELMVGVLLAMLVTVGMLMLFSNASTNDRNVQRASLQIENGRYAAELLRDELQLAGFFGELSVKQAVYASPSPCDTGATGFASNPLTLPTPVRGYAADELLSCLNSRRAGSHAIALRRLDTATVSTTAVASNNQQPLVQYSFCPNDPPMQRLVLSNDRNAFTLRNRACNSANVLRAFVSRVYYVSDCNRCGNGGDGVPTLKRLDLVGGKLEETPLVEGVETLRFEYGFDTDGDGDADNFLATAAVSGEASKWENVVVLRVHYVTRSLEKASGAELGGEQTFQLGNTGTVAAPNDGYARRAYSSTIRLVNPSAAREMQ